MSVGGPLLDISIGGRLFTVAGDADVATDLGGYSSERQQNGNLTSRNILTPKPWMLENVAISIDDTKGDLEFLQAVQDSPVDVPITVTYLSGVVRQGTGSIEGDLKSQSQATTATISLTGAGRLTTQ